MADTAPMDKDEAIDLLRDALEHYQRLAPGTITAREALRMTAYLVPSAAPEADPEKDFSDWMERRGALGAGAVPERIFYAGHSAGRRSALASRPAEVDDESLPPLPPASGRIYVQNGYTRASTRPGKGLPLFTAEQYRQGQRDAVAADRARRGAQP